MSDFSELEKIFHRVSEAEDAERQSLLDDLQARDPDLHRRVTELLEAEQSVALASTGDALAVLDPDRTITDAERETLLMTGDELANSASKGAPELEGFRFVRRLGEGGMGVVWEAEQLVPVRRRVAVKLIRTQGLESKAFLDRFAAEQQAQAMMDHPNIAKVFEAGSLPDGRPYFVMELVAGRPVTQYCDAHGLPNQTRLTLFKSVCAAVTHAHRRGVVHRDLKPSNVLVHEVDGEPSVKVIDFGIAKLLESSGTGIDLETRVEDVVGTPAYMSPEQISPDETGVDTRTDVYSLGVILFELLVGSLPHGPGTGSLAELLELRDKVVAGETPTPSTHLSTSTGDANRIAECRGTDVSDLVKTLRGELDWIVLKALHKDLDQRYESPAALERDIDRFLGDRPVEAGPPHWRYKLRKWVERNRLRAAAVVLIGLSAAVGAGGLVIGLSEARAARIVAELRADEAESSRDFLISLFELNDEFGSRADQVTAMELVQRGAGRLEGGLQNQPRLRATLLRVIAQTYRQLGDLAAAREYAQRAVAQWESLNDRRIVDASGPLTARLELARSRLFSGQLSEAESLLQEIVSDANSLGEEGRRVIPYALADLAEALRLSGATEEALGPALEAVERARSVFGPAHPETAWLLGRLGLIQVADHRPAEAERSWIAAVSILDESRGPLDPKVAPHLNNLATVLQRQGRGSEAEPLLRRLVDIDRARFGPTHPLTANALFHHGESLRWVGRAEEAAAALTEALAVQRFALGAHPSTALTLNELGLASVDLGRTEMARTLLEEALAMRQRVLGQEHPEVASSWSALADVARASGELDQAERFGRNALLVGEASLPASHPQLALMRLGLSDTLRRGGDLAGANDLLERAEAAFEGLPADHLYRVLTEVQRVELLIAQGRTEEAGAHLDRLEQRLSRAAAGDAGRAAVQTRLEAASAALGRIDDN